MLKILSVASLVAVNLTGLNAASTAPAKPNILFIAIDDLRSDLGALGVAHAKTPNLDTFAESGRLFTHHYVQVPTCGASRCSLLRGKYPDQRAHVSNNAIKSTQSDWGARSLPSWLRQHGYQTFALGKIGHYPGGLTGKAWAEGPEELPGAWDRCWIPDSPWKTAEAMMHAYANGKPRVPGQTPPLESFDGPDEAYPDAWVARDAVAKLQELSRSGQPWFFAVGMFKPHLPFASPKRWLDLHATSRISAPAVAQRPTEPSGWHKSGELRGNYRAPGGRDPDTDPAYADELRHAYAAAISYMDAQVGRVLKAAKELRLDDNTVIVIWSDHGFLLGEHAIWGKHCLYERALRSPMMIRYPGIPQPGAKTDTLVQTIDLFPTLLDLCTLPAPAGLDGRSLRPQLTDPRAASARPAHSFWTDGQRTIRTERWRLIAYPGKGKAGGVGVELFDLENDPDEARNAAAANAGVVKQLLAQLDRVPNPFAGDAPEPRRKK
ncbi:MAG: sulfatase [Opitutaceae bacterium]|nr:sulfatase [Opitutaceae bacterium]